MSVVTPNSVSWGVEDELSGGLKTSLTNRASRPTILDEIITRIEADLAVTKKQIPQGRLERHAEERGPTRGFADALRDQPGRPARVIAELKRASPSRGLIRKDFGVLSLSRELAEEGAAALSVLTEVNYFKGSPRYLQAVATAVEIPVLRKDFIVDPYQIFEARAWGADAVLLIAAALDAATFNRLHNLAVKLDLGVLAEVHNRDELHMVLDAGVEVVGVNSRNLKTFKTDLNMTAKLIGEIPAPAIAVAESGIHGPDDIAGLRTCGAQAFLVGETLMRAPSPGAKLAELIGRGTTEDGEQPAAAEQES
ncbi:MAG: indole-3-glycerol phosphate synthase TrpC [Lentisphaerae bacterium]|jgi:indole-3-glycerol phosphate synthase|nr:indole-3-glycerol phosphate synthase TrpC [Lentisphaerota bacterium]MBT4823222.1 indole-3-glycerol phosphate synthase TrpC [Lentisphaerota bacterium]MBT5610732.1 indole-3-glycerol phosphate synthase TrpC [Lentisphaerota bacterium]MBT7054301.1 indole-3-glycerol phosphate synthase TrpC [Lentisphaerota bacterium]MBT7844362.1 indole-3-glycerol phosphate synthase TrpC [Lentisphaerota bacterium]